MTSRNMTMINDEQKYSQLVALNIEVFIENGKCPDPYLTAAFKVIENNTNIDTLNDCWDSFQQINEIYGKTWEQLNKYIEGKKEN